MSEAADRSRKGMITDPESSNVETTNVPDKSCSSDRGWRGGAGGGAWGAYKSLVLTVLKREGSGRGENSERMNIDNFFKESPSQ